MDFKALRRLKTGNKVKIADKTYTIYKISEDAVFIEERNDYLSTQEFWMKRDEDQKDFVLQMPAEDIEEHVKLFMAGKTGASSWMFNPSKEAIKIEIL